MPVPTVPASASNGVVATGAGGGAVLVVVVGGGVVVVVVGAGGVLVGVVLGAGVVVGVVVGLGVVAAPGGVRVNASRRTPFSRFATTSVCVPALRLSVGPVIHVQFVRALLGTVSTRVEPPSRA
jgi:hypothetical protein